VSKRGLILGIESSCDETAAAVVERGARALSSAVASQIPTHARYGGVVPELASREHLRAIVPVVREALQQAGITLADLDAIAVTSGPGLAGALLVGITYAKALAFAQGLPLIAINHLEGHIHAVLLHQREEEAFQAAEQRAAEGDGGFNPRIKSAGAPGLAFETGEIPKPTDKLKGTGFSPYIPQPNENGASAPGENPPAAEEPALALVVSGGHTSLYLARPAHGAWSYQPAGRTVDDAAGEAYDKVAKLLGFPYPGGPWIDALARFGNPHAVPFAFAQIKWKAHLGGRPPKTKDARTAPIAGLDPRFLFSFSGIKTAVLRYVELHGLRAEAETRAARFFPPKKPGDPAPWDEDPTAKTLGTPSFSRPFEKRVEDHEPQPTLKPPKTKEEALAFCPQPVLDLVASFQHAVVGDLMKKTFAAQETLGARRILVTGGVAANRELRARFSAEAARRGLRIAFPTLSLSTDNAAMIAAAAWPRFLAGEFAEPSLSADPSLALGRG
jgi:N6-L-threonylcarbamoyladenine synthase